MAKVIIVQDSIGLGQPIKLMVDGTDLANLTNSLSLHMEAGGVSRLSVDMLIFDCEVSTEADITINAQPISREVGLQIYRQLRALFEPEGEQDNG